MMFESRICTKISELIIRNRYYTPDIARAERYLSSEKILYAFSPKKEKIVVVHEDNIYQYLYLSGGSLQIDCSCKKGPVCEHSIAALMYLKNMVKDLDEKCASEDNSSTLMKLKPEDIIKARNLVREVYLDEKIENYITDIVFATRYPEEYNLGKLKNLIGYGASPRGSINLALAAKAHAFIKRRGYVIPEDIRAVSMDVLRHRIGLTYEAEAENISTEEIINEILNSVEVP